MLELGQTFQVKSRDPHLARKKAPGAGSMTTKISEQVKLKMKRLMKANPFLTDKEIKITALKDISNQHVNKILRLSMK